MALTGTQAGVRRELFWQIVRFGVNGGLVTALLTFVYIAVDTFTHAPPQVCNFAGYVAAVVTGYALHSRVTFRGHGRRGRGAVVRFVLASLPSYVLNVFWTWLFTATLHWPSWTPLVPIWCITPLMIFVLNRWWVFR